MMGRGPLVKMVASSLTNEISMKIAQRCDLLAEEHGMDEHEACLFAQAVATTLVSKLVCLIALGWHEIIDGTEKPDLSVLSWDVVGALHEVLGRHLGSEYADSVSYHPCTRDTGPDVAS